ncbi:hypothetical protein LCGC14_1260090, partial [marine sediment metagenome]
MSFVKGRHDIGITDPVTSVNVGMMLAKREDRVTPIWEEHDGKHLADQFFTGAPSESYTDPETEMILGQSDFREGFGQEYFDSALRYYRSFGMDMRHKGRALLGWTATGITLPAITSVSITNADFELDANWTTGAGAAVRSLTQQNGGTYSWRVGTTDPSWVYQDLTYNANHIGHTFMLRCWIYQITANEGRIGIDDGDGAISYSDTFTATATWTQVTVSKMIGSSADKLKIILRYDGGTNYVYFDDIEIWQPVAGTIKAMKQFGDNQYFGIGNELHKLNGAGTGFTSLMIFPVAINSLEVFTDHMYSGLEDGVVIEDCEDAWTESVDAAVTSTLDSGDYKVGSGSAKFVAAAGIGVNTLWATEAISATNMSSADGIELWIKCSIAT